MYQSPELVFPWNETGLVSNIRYNLFQIGIKTPGCLDYDHAHGCDYDCDEDDYNLSYGKPNDAAKIEGAAKPGQGRQGRL